MSEQNKPNLMGPMTRRLLLRRGLGAATGLLGSGALMSFLAACGVTAAPPQPVPSLSDLLASGDAIPLGTLTAQAKREDKLNTIALPPTWANYQALLKGFPAKYGIPINNMAPDDSSGQELQAVITYKNNKSTGPDTVDVGPSFASEGITEGLWDPYRNSHWNSIPDAMKDPKGYWVGDYYGVEAFAVNTTMVKNVPQDWADLLKPEYKNTIGINGDPRSSNDAFMAVWAAALANGGSLDNIMPGIEFFAKLKKNGNFLVVPASSATIANRTTPIVIMWDYLLLGYRESFHGNPPLTILIPKTGVLGGYYCQAVSKYAPHPFAARLWEEYLYSDEGQLAWLEGYAHPVRYADLVKQGKVPATLAAKLPPASAYAKAQFPTVAQTKRAGQVLQQQWGPVVVGA